MRHEEVGAVRLDPGTFAPGRNCSQSRAAKYMGSGQLFPSSVVIYSKTILGIRRPTGGWFFQANFDMLLP
jgi:hypothetical protein